MSLVKALLVVLICNIISAAEPPQAQYLTSSYRNTYISPYGQYYSQDVHIYRQIMRTSTGQQITREYRDYYPAWQTQTRLPSKNRIYLR